MVETDVHYMDPLSYYNLVSSLLSVCFSKQNNDETAMVVSLGQKWRIKPNIQALAILFDSWNWTDYKISLRKLVKMIHLSRAGTLYVFLMVAF
jgi:hypothetical protein